MKSLKEFITEEKQYRDAEILVESMSRVITPKMQKEMALELHELLNEGFFGDIVDSFKDGIEKFQDNRKKSVFNDKALKVVRNLQKKLNKSQKVIDRAYPALMDTYKTRFQALSELYDDLKDNHPEFVDVIGDIIADKGIETEDAIKALEELERGKGTTTISGPEQDPAHIEGEEDLNDPRQALIQAVKTSKEMDEKAANSQLGRLKKAFGNNFGKVYEWAHSKFDNIPLIGKLPRRMRDKFLFVFLVGLINPWLGMGLAPLANNLSVSAEDLARAAKISEKEDAAMLAGLIEDPAALDAAVGAPKGTTAKKVGKEGEENLKVGRPQRREKQSPEELRKKIAEDAFNTRLSKAFGNYSS